MTRKIYLIIALLTATLSAGAQVIPADYWNAKPELHKVPQDFATASSVIINDDISIQYKDEDKKLWVYRTTHRIIKVQDEKGIESFNKMSVPTYDGMDIVTLKARTILPGGKVLEITKEQMKESKNDDGSKEIAFAMEGVEKDAEIEMLFCYKKPYALFGTETFQYGVPVMNSTFELTSPKRVVFEEKGYNGFPTVKDTLIGDVRTIRATTSMIPELHSESYSFYDQNRMRAEYKVSYLPEEHENVRTFTWKDLAKRLYENTYELTDKERKAVDKYMNTLDIKDSDSETEKIKKIETGIKTNITLYRDITDEGHWKLDYIIAKKSATEAGIIRLFAACFVRANVTHELGLTPDRMYHLFDAEFENWNIMDNYVFYFPNLKTFLYPAGMYLRYPFLPANLLGNRGVFAKLTTIGEVTNALADIRTITPMPVAASGHNINADISFSADMDATTDITYSFTGYSAMGMREAVLLLPKEKIKDLVQNIVNIADKPENIVKYTTANEAFENYYDNKPLLLTATVKTPQLVEKAGPKYILKIGDIIGRQDEMYQNTARKLPLDVQYPHTLNRIITVNIPEGYRVLNPETINIKAAYKDTDGNVTVAFNSGYKIDGNKMVVTISEFYGQLHFPQSDYEAFRKVINASADFNKVKLLLGK